jgi:1,2-diacylglycerol 3-alpha-glucosyltransferase
MTHLRILGIIVNLVPYHLARWTAVVNAGHQVTLLQRRAGDPFKVLGTHVDTAPFPVHTLADPTTGAASWHEQLLHWIDHTNPQVLVVGGYSFPESLAALLAAAQRDLPVVVCSESNWHDAPRRWWSETLKRRVLRLVQAGLVGGEPQASYLERLGLAPEAIFRGYNAVDNNHFATALQWRQQGEPAREQLGLPSRYLLAVSRFTPKKNLERLIEGFAHWRQTAPSCQLDLNLLILGDGPLRLQLEAKVRSLGLEDRVHLPGPCAYSDLPSRYGLAEGFIHASTVEQWGLVVNEAMAAGLPVLVSATCGCAPELVQPGVTGLRFEPHEASSIAAAIDWLVSLGPTAKRRIADTCRLRIASYGPDAFASGLEAALTHAIAQPSATPSRVDQTLLRQLILRTAAEA